MPDKSLRILLADAHPMQLLQLEKMLNGMGYFRIAPVPVSYTHLTLPTICSV